MLIPFGVEWDKGRESDVSTERLVNCFVESAGQKAKTPFPIYPRPGLTSVASGLDGTCRGQFMYQDRPYFVMGTKVYKLNDDESATVQSGTITGYETVTGGSHETESLLISEPSAYRYDGTAVSEITDEDLPNVVAGTVADGYGVLSRQGFQGQFYITRNRNFSNIDALDFASAETAPDSLVRPWWSQRDLLLFGKESTELWYNAGAADFPFARREDVVLPIGIIGPYAVADQDNTTIFTGHDGVVYRLQGFTNVRISKHSVEKALRDEDDLVNMESWAYDHDGHKFWFASVRDLTFVHDSATNLWHEWQTYDRRSFTGRHFARVPQRAGSDIGGNWYCGGVDEPKIYKLDPDTYTDDGRVIIRDMISPPIHSFPDELAVNSLRVDLKTGVSSLGGTEALIMLRWSHDGGYTWSDWHQRGLGDFGKRQTSVLFNGLGQGPQWTFHLRISDSVGTVVMNVDADVERRLTG